jgi:hypothetical protein
MSGAVLRLMMLYNGTKAVIIANSKAKTDTKQEHAMSKTKTRTFK